MNTKLLTIVSAIVLTLSVGLVNAEPVKLSSAQMDNVTAAGRMKFYKPFVNVAYADAFADAFGPNTKTSTYTETLTIYGAYSGSTSSSYSISK